MSWTGVSQNCMIPCSEVVSGSQQILHFEGSGTDIKKVLTKRERRTAGKVTRIRRRKISTNRDSSGNKQRPRQTGIHRTTKSPTNRDCTKNKDLDKPGFFGETKISTNRDCTKNKDPDKPGLHEEQRSQRTGILQINKNPIP